MVYSTVLKSKCCPNSTFLYVNQVSKLCQNDQLDNFLCRNNECDLFLLFLNVEQAMNCSTFFDVEFVVENKCQNGLFGEEMMSKVECHELHTFMFLHFSNT